MCRNRGEQDVGFSIWVRKSQNGGGGSACTLASTTTVLVDGLGSDRELLLKAVRVVSADLKSPTQARWLWVQSNGTILGQVHHPF